MHDTMFGLAVLGAVVAAGLGANTGVNKVVGADAVYPPGFFVTLNDGHKMPTISLGTCCGSTPTAGLVSWVAAGGVGIDSSIGACDRLPRPRRALSPVDPGPQNHRITEFHTGVVCWKRKSASACLAWNVRLAYYHCGVLILQSL
jgi:hypothetical protein